MAVLNGFVELPLKKAGLGDISVNINLITDIRVVTNPSNKWVVQVVITPGTAYTLDLGPFDTKEEALSAKQALISSFNEGETDKVGKVDWQDIENKPELQEKLTAGDNITIDPDTNVISSRYNEPDGATILLDEKGKLKVSKNLIIDGGFL